MQTLLEEATQHVKMRDMKSCAAFVQHAIKLRRMSTSMLSPDVINKFEKDDFCLKTYHVHYGARHWPAKRSQKV